MGAHFLLRFPWICTAILFASIAGTLVCSATVVRIGEACTSLNDCLSADEYCRNDNTCQEISYSPIIDTISTSSSNTAAFSLVMVTDVQFYYRVCKDQPLTECIFRGVGNDPAVREQLLRDAALLQKQCIDHLVNDNVLTDVKAIFNNGDITNVGTETELDDFKSDFHDLVANSLNLPMVVALGNHDYGNDAYGSDARKRMINFLAESMEELAEDPGASQISSQLPIRNIDFETTSTISDDVLGNDVVYTRGSFCYSIELNGYVFIVLHWATAINGGAFEDDFEADDSQRYTEIFNVTSVESWLRQELIDADNENKPVILVPHSYRGLNAFVSDTGFTDELRQSSVIAVLSGHDHDQWGYYTDMVVGRAVTRDIPVYYAGSTSYQKLITIDMQANQAGLTVTPYDTSGGSACASTTADTATRAVAARAYDELRIELKGSDRILSLCKVEMRHPDGKQLLPIRTEQSSTNGLAHSTRAFAKAPGYCSETTVGNKHYWAARFKPGYRIPEVLLEGNANIAGGLSGAKVFWNDRLVSTISTDRTRLRVSL